MCLNKCETLSYETTRYAKLRACIAIKSLSLSPSLLFEGHWNGSLRIASHSSRLYFSFWSTRHTEYLMLHMTWPRWTLKNYSLSLSPAFVCLCTRVAMLPDASLKESWFTMKNARESSYSRTRDVLAFAQHMYTSTVYSLDSMSRLSTGENCHWNYWSVQRLSPSFSLVWLCVCGERGRERERDRLKHQPVNGEIALLHDNTFWYMQLRFRVFKRPVHIRCSFNDRCFTVSLWTCCSLHQFLCNENVSNLLPLKKCTLRMHVCVRERVCVVTCISSEKKKMLSLSLSTRCTCTIAKL